MEFTELVQMRYSVRKFSENKVEPAKIKKILNLVRLAPTAANYQPQRIIVVESDDALANFRECTSSHFNAPLAIIVCYDKRVSWKHPMTRADEGKIDASIVGTHLMLAVAECGLGSTWVGFFDHDKVRKLFNLPPDIEPVALFPIGYMAAESMPSIKHSQRLDISETVVYDSF